MRRRLSLLIALIFLFNNLGFWTARADELSLPPAGVRIHFSPPFKPASLQGLIIHPDNAFKFDFLINRGDKPLTESQKKETYQKLVKYFLVSLTVPDHDQWVNLSPYEHNRIIEVNFGKTEMGRDLLAQDYILKQITSSLIYPEEGIGKAFWDKVYQRTWNEFHTTQVPVNTFNKVWIIPDQALVYEHDNAAFVVRNHLKVLLDEDYMSLRNHSNTQAHSIGAQIMREIVIPQLEQEVNEGSNFAPLRQIYSAMILATWYKHALKESLLTKVYANKAKTKGVEQDSNANELIYQRYLAAFKKGVFNYIKDEMDPQTHRPVPRKYFSGGTRDFSEFADVKQGYALGRLLYTRELPKEGIDGRGGEWDQASVSLTNFKDSAMISPSLKKKIAIWSSLSIVLTSIPLIYVHKTQSLPREVIVFKAVGSTSQNIFVANNNSNIKPYEGILDSQILNRITGGDPQILISVLRNPDVLHSLVIEAFKIRTQLMSDGILIKSGPFIVPRPENNNLIKGLRDKFRRDKFELATFTDKFLALAAAVPQSSVQTRELIFSSQTVGQNVKLKVIQTPGVQGHEKEVEEWALQKALQNPALFRLALVLNQKTSSQVLEKIYFSKPSVTNRPELEAFAKHPNVTEAIINDISKRIPDTNASEYADLRGIINEFRTNPVKPQSSQPKSAVESDKMQSAQPPGGIDLDGNKLNLIVSRENAMKIPLNFDEKQFSQIEGLVPEITSISPVDYHTALDAVSKSLP